MNYPHLFAIAGIALGVVAVLYLIARVFLRAKLCASLERHVEHHEQPPMVVVTKEFATDDIDRLIRDITNQADKKKATE
jgi:hypothetical protein